MLPVDRSLVTPLTTSSDSLGCNRKDKKERGGRHSEMGAKGKSEKKNSQKATGPWSTGELWK